MRSENISTTTTARLRPTNGVKVKRDLLGNLIVVRLRTKIVISKHTDIVNQDGGM